MLAKRLSIPFVLWALIVFVLLFVYDVYGITFWIIPPVIMLMVLYIFSPQLDWWYYNKYPPKIDEKMIQFLDRASPFYRHLDVVKKKEFERRLFMYLLGNDFSGMNIDSLSEDMKASVAIYAVAITFGQEDFMMNPYEKIIFYKHPFPSPNHRFLHSCEINHEDGVLIFSIEQLLQGQLKPSQFFNIGYYTYAEAFASINSHLPKPDITKDHWVTLGNASGFTTEHVATMTGYENPSLWGVASSIFFCFPEKLKSLDRKLFDQMVSYYNFNPIPVIRES